MQAGLLTRLLLRLDDRLIVAVVIGVAVIVVALVLTGALLLSRAEHAPLTVRVAVATLQAHPEASLWYPHSTAISSTVMAGLSVFQPTFARDPGTNDVHHNVITYHLTGYTGVPAPAAATAIRTAHAGAVQVTAWYRRWLLSHGWCLQDQTDLWRTAGIRLQHETYLRGQNELFEVFSGSTYAVQSSLGGPIPKPPTDFAHLNAYLSKLEQVSPTTATFGTRYSLYPAGTILADAPCQSPSSTGGL